jgi:hypothetical protein
MLPNIDVRLANCMKAITEVVIPSLPLGERLAREQAMLVIGHLKMIGDQWKWALGFESGSLDGMIRLAKELQQHEPNWGAELGAALSSVETIDRSNIDTVEQAIGRVGTAIDLVINGEEGTQPLSQAAVNAILTYGERQAFRERTWFVGCGLDPDKGDLPAISEVLV